MAIRRGKGVQNPKREVEWNGRFYKVRSNKIAVPDLKSLERFEALTWLCRETYPRGYSRLNPHARLGGVISIVSR